MRWVVLGAASVLLAQGALGEGAPTSLGVMGDDYFAGAARQGTVDGPPETVCGDTLTPMALEAEFTPLEPTDRVTLRVRAVTEEGHRDLTFVLMAEDPAVHVAFLSEDTCPHFEVEGTSVGTIALWVVRAD